MKPADINYSSEPIPIYEKELDDADTYQKLLAVVAEWKELFPEIEKPVLKMGEKNFPKFREGLAKASIRGLKAWTKRYGFLVMPDIEVVLIASHFGTPWGVAYLQRNMARGLHPNHEGDTEVTKMPTYVTYLGEDAPNCTVTSTVPIHVGVGETPEDALKDAHYWADQKPWVKTVHWSKAPKWARKEASSRQAFVKASCNLCGKEGPEMPMKKASGYVCDRCEETLQVESEKV
jgi:hypothetical protein